MSNDNVKLSLNDLNKKGREKVYAKRKAVAVSGDVTLALHETVPTAAGKTRRLSRLFCGEHKQMHKLTLIWLAVIAGLCLITAAVYPLVKVAFSEMTAMIDSLPEIWQDMIVAMFGLMDTFVNYYILSAGLGMMVGLFAGIIAGNVFSKDNKGNAAEFLYSMPISRNKIAAVKLGVLVSIVTLFNAGIALFSLIMAWCFSGGEVIAYGTLFAHFGSILLMSLLIAAFVFGLSMLSKKRIGLGLALGLVLIMYFLFIISAVDPAVEFIKYFTPMGIPTMIGTPFEWAVAVVWAGLALVTLVAGFVRFKRQDLV
ncbi:MAG: ABC transporter permease [Firmicutes bacterium]|nr:ABC transporter permease [Bacillota bacterium]